MNERKRMMKENYITHIKCRITRGLRFVQPAKNLMILISGRTRQRLMNCENCLEKRRRIWC